MVQPITVLIVDDSEADRGTYRRYVERNAALSCAVIEAELGELGLKLCQQAQPDVVLLDYRLPDLDGLEFLTTLKTLMGEQTPALILVTGQGSEAVATQSLKAGAADYLVKGQITPLSLQRSIERAVEQASLRRQLWHSNERLRLALDAAQMGVWEWQSSSGLFYSARVGAMFGLALGEILSGYRALLKRVHREDRAAVQAAIRRALQDQTQGNVEFRVICPNGAIRWLNGKGNFYPSGDRLSGRMLGTLADITPAKQAESDRSRLLESERVVMQITQAIRRYSSTNLLPSPDLNAILQAAVAEARRFLQTDRVVILQLQTPNDGVVVTESVGADWTALLNLPFFDPCLSASYTKQYDPGRLRAIADIHSGELTPCHVDFLASLQVKANLVVPILQGNTVWGLLIAHHCTAPRKWQNLEIKFLEQLSAQISLVVQQADLSQQAQQEIEERQQAEASLRESERQFRRAVVEAPFPIIIHGDDGRIFQISQTLTDITGYGAKELQTLNDWTERAYGKRQGDVLALINRLYDLDRRIGEGEFEVRTKSGERRTWLFSSAPLGQINDGTRLVISMAADVTAQKRAEAALASRLGQQAIVAQLSQAALSGSSLDVLFDQATQMLATSLGVDYCKVLELLPDGQSLLLRSGVGWQIGLVGQATVSSDRGSQAGYTLLSPGPVVVADLRTESRFSGPPLLTTHHVISGMSTIIGEQERPFGVLGVHSRHCREFTQDDANFLQAVANSLAAAIARNQSEQTLQKLNLTLEQRVQKRTQQLEAANSDLEAFSYSVAHDLRAPLRSIQGFARVLEEDCGPALDDLGRDYIHRMATSAETLDTLIQDLLTYSRLGRSEIHLQPVNVGLIVKKVLATLEPALGARQAKIEVAPNLSTPNLSTPNLSTSNLPMVYVQRSVIEQVLTNLIRNALKFVAPGTLPQIKIWAEASVDGPEPSKDAETSVRYVRIWVEDNGIGIAPQHQARIFEPFERLHGAEVYAGTGIGLSIVKRGIQRMGGQVGVESALGQGSRFWIELKRVFSD
ncbi:MAG: GAF domain-containing protein [Elainellaceae cyanobacterium]